MTDSVERGRACKSAHVPTAATKAGVAVGAIFALQDGAPTLWGIAHDIELVIFLHYGEAAIAGTALWRLSPTKGRTSTLCNVALASEF